MSNEPPFELKRAVLDVDDVELPVAGTGDFEDDVAAWRQDQITIANGYGARRVARK